MNNFPPPPYPDPNIPDLDYSQHPPPQQHQPDMSYATSTAPQSFAYAQQAQASAHAQYYTQGGSYNLGAHDSARNMQYGGQSSAYAYPHHQSGYPVQTPFTVPSNAPAPPSYPSAAAPQHYRPHPTQPIHPPHPPSSPSPSSTLPPNTERFPCPHCNKSFTRNFDRKRHMEIHSPGSSGNNRCMYCRKEYSRADSLKRHIDNGCEMKPSR